MAFRNLSARISGDASSYVSATRRAKHAASSFGSEATSLAGRLQLLQGRADEAGDEIAAAGRKAVTTSSLFSTLTLSTEGLALSFGSLSTVLSLSVIPALAALSTVLLPLTATAGVLAASLGGLGLGVIAGTAGAAATHTSELKRQLKSLVNVTKAAIAPLADAFVPLLTAIINGLGRAVVETMSMIGGFVEFRNAIWGVLDGLIAALPDALATLYNLGRDLLPVLQDMAATLVERAGPAFRDMQATAREVVPILQNFARAIIESLPQLNELGLTILQETVPALLRLFRNVLTPENIQSFIRFAREIKPVVMAAGDLAVAAGGLVEKLSGLDSFINSWTLVASLGALAAVLSGPGAVIAAVLGVATAVRKLKQNTKGGFKLDEFLADLKGLGNTIVSGFKNIASDAYSAFTEEFDGVGDFILKALGIGDEKQQALKAAVQQIGQNVGSWLTGAINNAVPNDFAFTLPKQTIDLGPLGKQTIGGDTVKFDIPDNPLGGGSGGSGGGRGGRGQSIASLAGGPAAAAGASTRELQVTGTLTTEDGEVVAKIDERVDDRLKNQAKQSELQ